MESKKAQLIVIRGNSGSGKSSVAKAVRIATDERVAIVEQDYLRRFILKEKETEGVDNIALLEQTANFALTRGYITIVEGILYSKRYEAMLERLANFCPAHAFFYIDVGFEETLKRHATKPNANDFGEAEMRAWYRHRDLLRFTKEIIIPEHSTLEETIELIRVEAGLKPTAS